MGIYRQDNVNKAITEVYNRELVHEGAAGDIAYNEDVLVRALTEIVARAQRALEQLADPTTAWEAVADLASHPGASGPIGSQWEKVVCAATKIQTLGQYALKPVDTEG